MNNMNVETIRLSVVDDHPVVFLGIQHIVQTVKDYTIELVNQYLSGSQLIDNLTNLNSDVLLIDLGLSDMKGYELARLVLAKYPDIKIGIYSSRPERHHILNSFKNGVMGYLPKTANSKEFIEFILTISKGERYVRGNVADVLFEYLHLDKKQDQLNITKRESEILQHIVAGCRNKEIAAKLNIAERTVEFHKQNIYVKFEVNKSVELYKAAQRHNLIYEKASSV